MGKFVVRELIKNGVPEDAIVVPHAAEFDLRKWEVCRKVVQGADLIIHMAAKVGGIGFNREKPGELFYDNIIMGVQLMEAARKAGVEKFVAIGTICAYPKFAPVPFKEENLWLGYPEETNAPYGLAKKMMLVQAQSYRQQYGFNAIYLLLTNLYGPGDNFDFKSSHVIPALIKKTYEVKMKSLSELKVWGTGRASREFLYVEDAALAIVLATEKYDGFEPVNIGSGEEITIKNLVKMMTKIIGFEGQIKWDKTKPDGQPKRKLNTSRAKKEFGFTAKTSFKIGLREEIEWYKRKYLKSKEHTSLNINSTN